MATDRLTPLRQKGTLATSVTTDAAKLAEVEIEFRPARLDGDDLAFVNSAFLGAMRENPYTKGLSYDVFEGVCRQAWRGACRDMRVTIAHAKDKPTEYCGYVVHDGTGENVSVAWVYVAKAWKRLGVSRALLAYAGVTPRVKFAVFFATPSKLALYRSKGFEPAFLPFACWRWLNESTMTQRAPEEAQAA